MKIKVSVVGTPERPQAGVLILQPAPSLREREDELAFAALVEIAAGSFRSRGMRLRHGSGVTYGVHAGIWAGPQTGLLAVAGDFEVDGVTDAITDLLRGFELLREQLVSSEELERAKRAIAAEFELSAATHSGFAAFLGGAFAGGRDPEQLRSLRAQISAITAEDLRRVARRYLQPENVEIGVSGPWDLANELSFIGRVETYNVAVE